MLGKNKAKFILSLQKKRTRDNEGMFLIEGDKIVREFLGSDRKIVSLLAKPEFISSLGEEMRLSAGEVISVSYDELRKLSSLKTPHNAIAVVKMATNPGDPPVPSGELFAALDYIQDPGNLGTIIRAAAWFGISTILCSPNCVDVYNPKVIQATMGAILNVRVYYVSLTGHLKMSRESGIEVYGSILGGDSIYSSGLGNEGIIVIGNESKGISDDLKPYISRKITIPKFTDSDRGIESLNAGMAASVVFSEFARRR